MSFSHFFALLNKNFIILKRTYILTSIEIISPILVILLFYIFKSLFKTENLDIYQDQNYIISNGTFIKDMAEGYNQYEEIDIIYRGIIYQCDDQSIALVGENFPKKIIDKLNSSRWETYNEQINFKHFKNVKDLFSYIENNNNEDDEICFGISYQKNIDKETNKVKYLFKLHYPASPYSKGSLIPSTNIDNLDPFRSQPDFSSYEKYIEGGFLSVQKLLYDYVLKKETNNPNAEIKYRLLPQKYEKYLYNIIDEYLNILLGFFVLIAYAFPLSINIYRLIKEKESKAKEIMKIMGLNELNYFLPYFIIYFIINLIYSIFNSLIISSSFDYIKTKYLFTFFFLFGLVIYSMVFFFQSFLEKTAISIIFCLIIYSIQFFLALILQENAIRRGVKILFGILFPPITMQLGINTFCKFQSNYKHMEENVDLKYNRFCISDMYIIFVANFFLYMFLGFYLQNVLPQKYGMNQPFYFLFTKSYWGFGEKNEKSNINNIDFGKNIEIIPVKNPNNNYGNDIIDTKTSLNNEKGSIWRKTTIPNELNNNHFLETNGNNNIDHINNDILRIRNIIKLFGDKLVLDNLSFDLYRNEIFVLLGHNGAGKTVLLNILTGLIKANSGSIIYNSENILSPKGLDFFRKIIGICPQEDILFDNLTVEEHLKLFCKFKSVPNIRIEQEITKVLYDLNLLEKKFTKISDLSGGQKRKVSIAMALIGGSSIIFLDEPTSGMDIISRRNLWDILKRCLNGKIIILTTHYMEEATVLGNRIGILSEGKIQCIGDPLSLINKFTKNIKLNITKDSGANDENIINFVNKNIANININITYELFNKEILFKISNDKDTINWSLFFQKLDSQKESLYIKNYSISMPTLEDVFIKLSKLSKENNINKENMIIEYKNNQKSNDILYDENNYILQNNSKIIRGLIGSFNKRLYQIIREKMTFLIEIICPIILTLIGCLVGYIQIIDKNKAFPLHLNQITNDTQLIMYSFIDDNNINKEKKFNDIFLNYSNEDLSKISFKHIDIDTDMDTNNNFIDENNFINIFRKHHEIQKTLTEKSYVYYIISEIDKINHQYEFNTIIDITSRQAAPIYPNFLLNNFVRYATENKNLEIEIINEPFPISKDEIQDEFNKNKFVILFFTSLAFSLIPSNFIGIIIKERENNSKHLQVISGISLFSYWLINYCFELIKYYVIAGICILIIFLFKFYEKYLYILYLIYGPAMISFTYIFNFIFKSEDHGQIVILLINLVIGVLGGTSIILMRLNEDLKKLSIKIIYFLRIIPSFCFCYGYNQLMRKKDLYDIDSKIKLNLSLYSYYFLFESEPIDDKEILKLDYIGTDCIYLAVETVFYLLILIIIENRQCENKSLERINDINTENHFSVSVQNLSKNYYSGCSCKKIEAIKKLSFNLNHGEIFGFLGLNGAGKTTTFKCLTNEIYPSEGNLYIDNYNITKHFNKVRNLIGYCPQFDAIFGYLTVYENLKFYGLIKGAKKEILSGIVMSLIDLMNLTEFKDILSKNLSGGNKRKLSVAIALICNPPIILLDEPSTGMDPEARRYMWKIIHDIAIYRKKSTIIMTTHSMEEAETLCEKIGILVKGELLCLGTSDEIKDTYGYGFEINFQINKPDINDVYKIFFVNDEDKEQIIYLNCLDECFRIYYLDKYKTQLKEGLLGGKLLDEINSKGYIPFKKILLWIYNIKCVLSMINMIKPYFNEIHCIDYDESNFVFKIKRNKTKDEKSIGFLFGLIEDNKNKFNIGPYYLRYSSLENIFNIFARINGDNNYINYQKDIEITQDLLDNFLN